MTDEERSSKKSFTIIRIVITLVFLAILAFIAFTFISGRGFNFDWFTNLLFPNEHREVADELFFNVGRGRVFADLETSVAAAGSLGVQVLTYGGTEIFRESFTMNSPAISYINGHAIVFDIGGKEVRVINDRGIIASITKNGQIVSASINQNGWFTVDSQEGEGYRGTTSVYDNEGRLVYRVNLSSGYILSSAISHDNNNLAVLNLTDYESKITFYNGLDKDYDDGSFKLSTGLILDIRFLESGDLLAVTTDALIFIDPLVGSGWEVFSIDSMRLGGYIIGSDFIVLHLLDFGIGHRGKLILIDHFGNLYGEILTDRELISMSLLKDSLAVMFSDGLILLDRSLNPLPLSYDSLSASGVSQILALEGGATLVAGDRFAIIIHTP